MRPKAPVRAALLEVKAIVDGPLATLAPLERHRSLPDRKRRQEKEFLRQDLGTRIWGSGAGRSGAGGTKDGEFGACGQAGTVGRGSSRPAYAARARWRERLPRRAAPPPPVPDLFRRTSPSHAKAASKTKLTTGKGSNASSAPPSSAHEAPRG